MACFAGSCLTSWARKILRKRTTRPSTESAKKKDNTANHLTVEGDDKGGGGGTGGGGSARNRPLQGQGGRAAVNGNGRLDTLDCRNVERGGLPCNDAADNEEPAEGFDSPVEIEKVERPEEDCSQRSKTRGGGMKTRSSDTRAIVETGTMRGGRPSGDASSLCSR